MNYRNPIAFAAATFLAVSPVLATADMPIGPPFRIDLPSGQRFLLVSDPVAGRAPDGISTVVWRSGFELRGRRVAADGTRLGSEFVVGGLPPQSRGVEYDIAVDGDGEAVVVWRSAAEGTGRPIIAFRRYAADGAALGNVGLVDAGDFGDSFGSPTVATDVDGDFIVGWSRGQVRAERGLDVGFGYHGTTITLGGRQVRARRYDRDGNATDASEVVAARADITLESTLIGIPIGGPAVGGEVDLGLIDQVDVAMDADGDHLVAWGGGSLLFAYALINIRLPYPAAAVQTTAIFARRYDARGVAVNPLPVQVDTAVVTVAVGGLPLGAVNGAPRVAMEADGDFAVTWTRQVLVAFGQQNVVQTQRYTARGRPLARIGFRNTEPGFGTPGTVAITAAGSDGYVLVWNANGAIEAARVASQGAAAGGGTRFRVAFDDGAVGYLGRQPEVTADVAGNPLVVWEGFDRVDGAYRILGRRFGRN